MSKAGRPLLWAAGLCLIAMAAVVCAVVLLDPRHESRPRPVDVPRASPAAAASVVADLVTGIENRDAVFLAELAPPGDDKAADLLDAVGANARLLDLGDVNARYIDQVGTVNADGAWTGVVEMTWRFGDIDPSPARAEVLVSFAADGDQLGITGFGNDGSRGRTPLWLRGALSVVSTPDVLVLVEGSQDDARLVARRVSRGIDVVRRVLLNWQPRVVVEVPSSAASLNRALGVSPGTYDAIAAVTATVDGSARNDAPVHVFVNPDVTSGLRRAGAQVVMSHELVHVATEAATTSIEPWLLEGFADYVALRDVGLPESTTMRRAIALAKRVGAPRRLPGAEEFDTRAADLQAVYEQAWLACRIVAEQLGEQELVALYRAASRGVSVDRALRESGLDPRELRRLWRVHLRELVKSGAAGRQ